jgi:hypothetical protein
MGMKIEDLSVTELKTKLQNIWRKYEKLCRTQMAPLLFNLRLKLKAQGKTGAGFGAWVEDTLDISRRTADRWADNWGVSAGLQKPSKRVKATFRQMSKSAKDYKTADGKVVVNWSMALTTAENKEWLTALRVLGSGAQQVVFSAVINAADRPPKKPVAAERKRLTVPAAKAIPAGAGV